MNVPASKSIGAKVEKSSVDQKLIVVGSVLLRSLSGISQEELLVVGSDCRLIAGGLIGDSVP